jgi:hypothetical protein
MESSGRTIELGCWDASYAAGLARFVQELQHLELFVRRSNAPSGAPALDAASLAAQERLSRAP